MSDTSAPTLATGGRSSPDGGQDTTEQIKDKASEAAGQVQDKAQQAAEQAKGRAQQMIDQRSTDVGEQVVTTAGALRSVGDQLRDQGQDGPARIVDQAVDHAERIGGRLRDADADQLLSDVEDLARRQPWLVVAGGIALGFAAARFLKASSSQRYAQRTPGSPTGNGAGGHDLQPVAQTVEGIDSDGRRFARPETTPAPGFTAS
jgi:hypothetical protein